MKHVTLCVAALVVGCSSAAPPSTPEDAARSTDTATADVFADAPSLDTPADLADADARPDVGAPDAQTDSATPTDIAITDAPDSAIDDAALDASTDLGADVSTDISADISTDTPADSASDVPTDAPTLLLCATGTANCNSDPADGCEASLSSPAHCGRCGSRCLTLAPNAVSVCESGACVVRCAEGYVRTADRCELMPAMNPPRLVAPLSHRISSSRVPTFEWVNRHGSDLAILDLCEEPSCPTASTRSVMVTGSRYTPAAPILGTVLWWRVRGRFSDGRVTTHSPVWQLFVENRTTPSRPWGVRLDVDRDGNADFIAPTAETTTTPGSLSVVTRAGAPTSAMTATAVIRAPTGALGFAGRAGTTFLRAPIAVAGDVNGDGFVDLLATAPVSGQVYVYHGAATGLPSAPSATLMHLPSTDMRVAEAGDVNHDGYSDALVSDADGAYLYLGSETGLRGPTQSLPHMAVAGAGGDINDDGFDDAFLMQQRSTDWGLQLCPSLAGAALSCVRTIRGTLAGGRVEVIGMHDDDSVVDFVASGEDLRVYAGSIAPRLISTRSRTSPGYAIGDSDGDGHDDFAASGSFNDITFFRPETPDSPLPTIRAPCCMPGDQVFPWLASSGLRRDGYSELYVAMLRMNRYVIAVYRWPLMSPYPVASPIVPTVVAGVFDPNAGSALSNSNAAWTVTTGN